MNITKLETVTKAFIYRGSVHLLAYSPELREYVAINRALIGPDGHLLRQLNGMQMHMNPTLQETIQSVKDEVDIEHYMAQGLTKAQAICRVMQISWTEELEKILV